jgi:transposase
MATRGKTIRVILSESDKEKVRKLLKAKKNSGRLFTRALILKMLDQSLRVGFVAQAVGVSGRTVTNIGRRYLAKGLDYAISENPRTGRTKVITDRNHQEIIAIACTDAPEGHSRWTLSLLAETAIKKRLFLQLAKKKSESY